MSNAKQIFVESIKNLKQLKIGSVVADDVLEEMPEHGVILTTTCIDLDDDKLHKFANILNSFDGILVLSNNSGEIKIVLTKNGVNDPSN